MPLLLLIYVTGMSVAFALTVARLRGDLRAPGPLVERVALVLVPAVACALLWPAYVAVSAARRTFGFVADRYDLLP